MDVVYICRPGKNEELRYSIRSVTKNAPADNVWVIGGKPDWYIGNFIPVANVGGKFNSIRNCIRVACETPGISEDFILMNDDFFILRNQNLGVYYYGGLLNKRAEEHEDLCGSNEYSMLLRRTDTILKKQGIKNPLNYDVHVHMPINKTKMLSVVKLPYSVRSYYGNTFNVGGTDIEDVKIYSHPLFKNTSAIIKEDTPFISTEDGSLNEVLDLLKERFPEPSEYELPKHL